MEKILVTGGCGYIGSHTVIDLINKGYEVIMIDNLINSYRTTLDLIRKVTGRTVPFADVDLCSRKDLMNFFRQNEGISCIIHFAALKSVEESVEKPLLYYRNNVLGMMNLLETVKLFDIGKFIFSSSCTVYGEPEHLPVTEESPIGEARSPYGRTKQICENMIIDLAPDLAETYFVVLRYFNPAGAHDSGIIGEYSKVQARSLIPVIMEVGTGKRGVLTVFGNDYNTRDGSCIRDYVHIMDLAEAHSRSINFIRSAEKSQIEYFNLGMGEGVTVLEAIDSFERCTGLTLNYEIGSRRPGDVAAIYSDFEKANKILGWSPKYSIDDIMKSAWQWEHNKNRIRW